MSETQEKWKDVISKMEGLGLKLKLHLEQESSESAGAEQPAAEPNRTESAGDKNEPSSQAASDADRAGDHATEDPTNEDPATEDPANVDTNTTKAALEELGSRLQDAFSSMGHAVKDPAVKDDIKDIGATLKDAVMQTMSTVGSQVEGVVKKTSNSDTTDSDTTDSETTDSGSASSHTTDSSGSGTKDSGVYGINDNTASSNDPSDVPDDHVPDNNVPYNEDK